MTKAALCVGINDYPGTAYDLAGCANDARDWARALERRGYAAELVLDRAATKAAIVAALSRLVASARSGDSLVFTYSGHGSWVPDDDGDEPDHRDESLCPHDIDRGAQLLDDELAAIFAKKREDVRLTMIADSCHSGTVTREPVMAGCRRRTRFLPPSAFARDSSATARLHSVAEKPFCRAVSPVLLVAACGDDEYSYDDWFDGRANGAFTRVALASLASDPATPREWMARIRKLLPTDEHPQTPRLFGPTSLFDAPLF